MLALVALAAAPAAYATADKSGDVKNAKGLSKAQRKAVDIVDVATVQSTLGLIVQVRTAGNLQALAGKDKLKAAGTALILRFTNGKPAAVLARGKGAGPKVGYSPTVGAKPSVLRLGSVTWFVLAGAKLSGLKSLQVKTVGGPRKRPKPRAQTSADWYVIARGLVGFDDTPEEEAKLLDPAGECARLRDFLATLKRELASIQSELKAAPHSVFLLERLSDTSHLIQQTQGAMGTYCQDGTAGGNNNNTGGNTTTTTGGDNNQTTGGNNTTGSGGDPVGTKKDHKTDSAQNVTAVANGAAGKVIFAQEGAPDRVGVLDLATDTTVYVSIDDLATGPTDVAWGPDNMVWWASDQRVGRVDLGAMTNVSWAQTNSPRGLAVDNNGHISYAAQLGNSIQEVPLAATGTGDETPHPTGASTAPTDLVLVNGKMCWSEHGANDTGCSPFGSITHTPLPMCVGPGDMAADGTSVYYVVCNGSAGANNRIIQVTDGTGVTNSWAPVIPTGSPNHIAIGAGKVFYSIAGGAGFAILDTATGDQTTVSLSCVPLDLDFIAANNQLLIACSGGEVDTYQD